MDQKNIWILTPKILMMMCWLLFYLSKIMVGMVISRWLIFVVCNTKKVWWWPNIFIFAGCSWSRIQIIFLKPLEEFCCCLNMNWKKLPFFLTRFKTVSVIRDFALDRSLPIFFSTAKFHLDWFLFTPFSCPFCLVNY